MLLLQLGNKLWLDKKWRHNSFKFGCEVKRIPCIVNMCLYVHLIMWILLQAIFSFQIKITKTLNLLQKTYLVQKDQLHLQHWLMNIRYHFFKGKKILFVCVCKSEREQVDLAFIPLDNYFQCMTVGGSAPHWVDERHRETVYLPLFFTALPSLCFFSLFSLSLQLSVSLSHPLIIWCFCHRSKGEVCVCLRELLTCRSCTSFNKDLQLMTNVSHR